MAKNISYRTLMEWLVATLIRDRTAHLLIQKEHSSESEGVLQGENFVIPAQDLASCVSDKPNMQAAIADAHRIVLHRYGSVSAVARLLGRTRHGSRQKMDAYGLHQEERDRIMEGECTLASKGYGVKKKRKPLDYLEPYKVLETLADVFTSHKGSAKSVEDKVMQGYEAKDDGGISIKIQDTDENKEEQPRRKFLVLPLTVARIYFHNATVSKLVKTARSTLVEMYDGNLKNLAKDLDVDETYLEVELRQLGLYEKKD